ncbi:hypothetical protein BATDEDRAFT_36201 [Batrachochytrium dendrobatidis JAM81]|uniref:3-hydroxy-3-methylglutaryl coenzyme A reductase n=1 Tax=Batrachochytrium dendrobatidis (strain JAM81 / FGSC 10211) TaxID=684364 RepID=F4PDD0_BATDJ|nr:uncharacterized protein BATDEDRAFT_36201 [Batrachochytrium dendrobatidis JAM81]EGF76662.1 hypothetical protein BATDEDRAFT_36201 [Batrachochytrium dendrobatidis JAM81]|eukprot:XP_006682657.1 hypothetical protein BATDEDRAFT_36201 [Batrachochytrium dendrobatidis JAM81]
MMSSHPIPSPWSGFYRKAIRERQNQLCLAYPSLFGNTTLNATETISSPANVVNGTDDTLNDSTAGFRHHPFPLSPISDEIADNMIENCVGTIGLPIGLALNFVINGEQLVIPMVVEEPSVVAAVSGAAKTICQADFNPKGFEAFASERNIIFAQIQLLDVYDVDIDRVIQQIQFEKDTILAIANEYCSSMYKRGGGAVDITVRKITRSKPKGCVGHSMKYWLVVHVHIDVCDAMGANCASTVAEGVAPFLTRLSGGRVGFRIVSNLSTERIATARFKVPISKMAYKDVSGEDVANHIVEAYEWACDDHFRAITHNKGIMNGIDAVAIATGQDWRAIEAASHIAATTSVRSQISKATSDHTLGSSFYGPLSRYWIEDLGDEGTFFRGEMSLPICVGASGGVLKTNPVYRYNFGLMGYPDAKKLAMIMVSVGLAQNFAALRALCTEGIQRGHMSLHARNIAVAVGAPAHAIQECTSFMVKCGRITSATAKEYLGAHHLQSQIAQLAKSTSSCASNSDSTTQFKLSRPLSMFCFEEMPSSKSKVLELENRLSLNIAFASYSEKPINIEMTPSSISIHDPLIASLFGSKTFEWINAVPGLLARIKLSSIKNDMRRSNRMLSKKLKIISVLLNILTRRLLASHPAVISDFLAKMFELSKNGETGHTQTFEHVEPQSFSKRFRTHSTPESSINGLDDAFQGNISNLGIFQCDPYYAVDFVRARSTDEMLLVGVPLLMALWQVFNYRVAQWVGDTTLATSLVEEQSNIIECLAATLPSIEQSITSETPLNTIKKNEYVATLLHLHAKRFQTTLILLCDAVTLDIPLDSHTQRHAFRDLGRRLENEQAIAHDLSPDRILRDLAIVRRQGLSLTGDLRHGLVNIFLAWLHVVRQWPIDRIIAIGDAALNSQQRFLGLEHEMRDFVGQMQTLESSKRAPIGAAEGIDAATLDLSRNLEMYREYYGVLDLFKKLTE